jgi:hypothetical protein
MWRNFSDSGINKKKKTKNTKEHDAFSAKGSYEVCFFGE